MKNSEALCLPGAGSTRVGAVLASSLCSWPRPSASLGTGKSRYGYGLVSKQRKQVPQVVLLLTRAETECDLEEPVLLEFATAESVGSWSGDSEARF
jgi:hypothetical protein